MAGDDRDANLRPFSNELSACHTHTILLGRSRYLFLRIASVVAATLLLAEARRLRRSFGFAWLGGCGIYHVALGCRSVMVASMFSYHVHAV